MGAKLREDAIGAEQEHAAVPETVACGEQGFGGGELRLFDEARDLRRLPPEQAAGLRGCSRSRSRAGSA